MTPARTRLLLVSLLASTGLALPAGAQSDQAFYRAFYLEQEQGDHDAALALYLEVAADESVDPLLRERAVRRAEGLAEERAASDFARLVPASTLFYAELSRPGEELLLLLDELGLLAREGPEGRRRGISPLLIRGLFGMRGAALAITGVDMARGQPTGVFLLHPGDLDVVRGLIETVVPLGGQPAEAVLDRPTWKFEPGFYVTISPRLVVVGQSRRQIRGVFQRLAGSDEESLADSAVFRDAMASRGDDLLRFCLNPGPILPLAQLGLQQLAKDDPQAAAALDLLDLQSLESVSGRFGLDERGIALELGLKLGDDHQSLAFNLLRMPHVERATLESVPAGAAFFLATTLNPEAPVAPLMRDGADRPALSLMDFGRELFANLVDVVVYGLPPEERADDSEALELVVLERDVHADRGVETGDEHGHRDGHGHDDDHGHGDDHHGDGHEHAGRAHGTGNRIAPDVAAILRVNDPARSRELWQFVLGLAARSSGCADPPAREEIRGVAAEVYSLHGVPVYLAGVAAAFAAGAALGLYIYFHG